ncbi:helix-turn-helix domain-containing protein [Kitasatospora sp. RB6PN24]|uniref:helix-turn-helix domain-containing protein n=1 Tax=Kitasatospora humi TaxID=2893891 RepID=UPI001E4DA9AA|nr:helix-turn-helix transcriptional regulator [Kitasatospora humi]MCC9311823.1 helix-turn-helix domain-containing protein [Kitasatospora humi]
MSGGIFLEQGPTPSSRQWVPLLAVAVRIRAAGAAVAGGGEVTFGEFIAKLRTRKGWYQRDLAAEVGRSEEWVSGVERGLIPVRNVEMLSLLARVLGTTLEELLGHPQPARVASSSSRRKVSSARLTPSPAAEEDDDEVRRRELLAATAAAVFVPIVGAQSAGASPAPLAPLEDMVLYGSASIPGQREPSAASVRASIMAARQDFRAARYDALAQALPGWIAAAQSVGSSEESARAVAALYNVAVRLCIKLGDDGLVAITSDRALNAARTGGDGLIIAEAQRMVSSAWRRQGHLSRATDIAVRAAHELQRDNSVPEPARLAAEGDLFATAAYTAAKLGDRSYAHSLIAEAADNARAAGRASGQVDGIQGVALHQLSVHYELGDAGQAIELARTVDPTALPTAERQARFFIDVARAFSQWGKPEQTFRALLAAEQAAPQEIRRGSVRRVATDLLRHDRSLPGIRDFATRAGVQLG